MRNTGSAPVTITGATITGADAALFARVGTLPPAIPAGGSATIPVTFNPTTAGPRGAVLTLTTDSSATPSITSTLRGLGTLGTGGSNEPSLQWILDTLQIPVNAGDTDPTNNTMSGDDVLLGDEIEVESFKRDPFDNIVKFEPLALFGPAGPNGNTVTVAVHDSSDPTDRTVVGVGPNNQNQLLLPTFTGTGATDLPDTFGFDFTWHGLSDRVSWSEDARNTWSPGAQHKVRVYPLKNADGSVEPYAYVIAPEDVPTGVDFQDAVMIVRNVQPVITAGNGNIEADKPELVYSGVKGTTSAGPDGEGDQHRHHAPGHQQRDAGRHQPRRLHAHGWHPGHAAGRRQRDVRRDASSPAPPPSGSAPPCCGSPPTTRTRPSSTSASTAWLAQRPRGQQRAAARRRRPHPRTQHQRRLDRPDQRQPRHRRPARGRRGRGPAVHQGGHRPGDHEARGALLPRRGAAVRLVPADGQHPRAQRGRQDRRRSVPDAEPGDRRAAGRTASTRVPRASACTSTPTPSTGPATRRTRLNTGVPHAARIYPAKNRAGIAIPNTYLVAFEDASNGDYQDYVFEVSNVRVAGSTGGTVPVAKIDFGPAGSTLASGLHPRRRRGLHRRRLRLGQPGHGCTPVA